MDFQWTSGTINAVKQGRVPPIYPALRLNGNFGRFFFGPVK